MMLAFIPWLLLRVIFSSGVPSGIAPKLSRVEVRPAEWAEMETVMRVNPIAVSSF
jgi:hypothetical protein